MLPVLLTAGDPILEGEASGDAFGAALAGGHDIDGDGLGDLVVGAPGHDAGGTDAGAVYVYAVTATGLDPASGVRTDGEVTGGGFGSALLLVPDLDGDGYADVVAGAPGADEASVYLGSEAGLSLATTLTGTASTRFGYALGAGDFDGDGDQDLAVGAPDGGEVLAFENDDGAFTKTAWTTLSGESSGGLFGFAVAGVPDADGDGNDELAAGAPEHSNGTRRGNTYLFAGTSTGLATTAAWEEPENTYGAGIGTALAAGDFDGDGLGDLATGTTIAHQVWVYAGSTSGLASAGTYSPGPGADYADSGEIVLAALGDSDGDGDEELAYSGYQAYAMSSCDCYFGRTTAVLFDVATNAEAAFHPASPTAFAPTGDVDGNGLADLAVGLAGDAGLVSIRLAATDADGDGAYADHGSLLVDCDDGNDTVAPTADDPPGDGIDQDCDGADGVVASDHAVTCPVLSFDTLPSFRENYCGFDPCPVDLAHEVWSAALAAECGRDEETSGIIGTCDSLSGPRLACDGEAEGAQVTAAEQELYDDGVRCWMVEEETTTTVADATLDAATAGGVVGARYWSRDGTSTAVDDTRGHLRWPDGTVSWFSTQSADLRHYDEVGLYWYGGETTRVEYGGCTYGYAWDIDKSYQRYTATIQSDTEVAVVRDYSDCASLPSGTLAATIAGTTRLVDDSTWAVLGTDADGDGWPLEYGDCDDDDPEVNPCGEEDRADAVDEDCSGTAGYDGDEDGVDDANDCDPLDPAVGGAEWAYPDADGDGYGHPDGEYTCAPAAGTVADGGDCDDDDPAINPGAPETCDGIDNNCDERVDEFATDAPAWIVDDDGDGYGAPQAEPDRYPCEAPDDATDVGGDCDDDDSTVHPGASDTPGDGIDQDCDGVDDPGESEEGDKAPGCAEPGGCSAGAATLPLGLALLRRRRSPRAPPPPVVGRS